MLSDSSNCCKNLKEFSLVKSCILFWETVKLYEVENVEFVQKFWFSFWNYNNSALALAGNTKQFRKVELMATRTPYSGEMLIKDFKYKVNWTQHRAEHWQWTSVPNQLMILEHVFSPVKRVHQKSSNLGIHFWNNLHTTEYNSSIIIL